MATKAFFNVAARRIELTEAPVDGVISIDLAADLYSGAKDDWLANLGGERAHRFPFITAESAGQDTTGGRDEPAFFRLRNGAEGWRIVPFDADHDLVITGTLIPTDNTVRMMSARPGRTILVITDGSEVAQITQGNALSASQKQQILEVWQLEGLEAGNEMTVTPAHRSINDGTIEQDITGDGETTTTVTRV